MNLPILCTVVRRAFLAAIVVKSLFNYILELQIFYAKVTRPFLPGKGSGHVRVRHPSVSLGQRNNRFAAARDFALCVCVYATLTDILSNKTHNTSGIQEELLPKG